MPIIDITQASVRADGPSYKKFDITKDDLKTRILIPSMRIEECFVHALYRAEAEMKEENGRTKPDWPQSAYAGNYICTGEHAKVAKSPYYGDPDGCAACASLHSGPRVASAPRKTFALNVLEYETAPNDTRVTGHGVSVRLWKHSDDRKINPILAALAELEGKKINQMDFIISCPPDGVQFKKWDMQFVETPAYSREGNEPLKAAVVNAIKNDLYSDEDLTAACGESVTADQLSAEVKAAVAAATAGRQAPADSMFAADKSPAVAPASVGSVSDDSAATSIAAEDIDDLL